MVTPEEEPLILEQFLRFGETRAIVQLMTASPAPNTSGNGSLHRLLPSAQVGQRPAPLASPTDGRLFQGALAVLQGPGSGTPLLAPLAEELDLQEPSPRAAPSFLCPLPPSSSSSLLCPAPSASPGGRKGRVCCGLCGKSFYDKG